MKPRLHIYWSAIHRCYKCYALDADRPLGRGNSPREAYHSFMIANGFKLKEAQ